MNGGNILTWGREPEREGRAYFSSFCIFNLPLESLSIFEAKI